MRGKVTSIQKFGAFVDVGGIEGLLPISEIAWTRTEKVSDLLSQGQEVEVIIKKLDWETTASPSASRTRFRIRGKSSSKHFRSVRIRQEKFRASRPSVLSSP